MVICDFDNNELKRAKSFDRFLNHFLLVNVPKINFAALSYKKRKSRIKEMGDRDS